MQHGNAFRIKSRQKRRRSRLRLKTFAVLSTVLALAAAMYMQDESGVMAAGYGNGTHVKTVSWEGGVQGRVTHVRDGDTIELAGIAVRIANLNCAERGTAAGERARIRMQQLAGTGQFSCRLEGRRSYDREVGICALPDGRDVGEVLIAEGQCGRWY